MTSIEKAIIISSLMISSSIVGFGILYSTRSEYEFINVNDNSNTPIFAIRINKRDGARCLMREGYVLGRNDWKEYASIYAVPTNLCR